jgi:glycosyltransferase involved in cell wall biosynthesis
VVGGLHPEGPPSEEMGTRDRWYAHSICGSTYGIAAALSQHGFDAYPFKGFRDREPFDTADVMFVSEWNLAEYVEENGLWDFKKPAVLLLHSDSPGRRHSRSELLSMYRGICFTRRKAFEKFTHDLFGPTEDPKQLPSLFSRMWVAEWGVPDWWTFPPVKPNPYEPGTKNIVYAGRLTATHRVYQWIREVAAAFPYATVWVIANVEPGHEQIEHDLAQIPNVRFLGRMPHGTFQHYLYYADVALDSGTAGEARLVNNCKLWDYLACGVPVVMDGATGGDELVKATGLGTIVPKDDGLEYRAAVEWYLNEPVAPRTMRDGAIRFMKENHTWSATVACWVDDFRKAVS